MSRISRRTMLKGATAGLAMAAVVGLASSGPGSIAVAAEGPAFSTQDVDGTRSLVGGTVPRTALHHGCYCAGETQEQADASWQGNVGRTMSVTKKYNKTAVFPTDLTTNNIDNYIRRGVKVCINFKPSFDPLSADHLAALDATLHMYANAHLDAEICLWNEPGNKSTGMSAAQYEATYRYYGPTVRKYYPLVANLNYADLDISRFTDYAELVTGLVDKFSIDYYYNNFGANHRLDDAAGIADRARLPFGIWECSTAGPGRAAPDQTAGTEYMTYLTSFMQTRLQQGKPNADVIWFDGTCVDQDRGGQPVPILSPSDYRVPLYQRMWDALSAASPGFG